MSTKRIVYFNALPCKFDGFIDLLELTDGNIGKKNKNSLIIMEIVDTLLSGLIE